MSGRNAAKGESPTLQWQSLAPQACDLAFKPWFLPTTCIERKRRHAVAESGEISRSGHHGAPREGPSSGWRANGHCGRTAGRTNTASWLRCCPGGGWCHWCTAGGARRGERVGDIRSGIAGCVACATALRSHRGHSDTRPFHTRNSLHPSSRSPPTQPGRGAT